MLIAIFYDFKKVNSKGERVFSFLVALGVFGCLLWFTLFVIIHFFKNKDKQYDPNDKYQVLYQGLKGTR